MELNLNEFNKQIEAQMSIIMGVEKKAFNAGYAEGYAEAKEKFEDADLKKEMVERESPEEEAERIKSDSHNEDLYDAAKERGEIDEKYPSRLYPKQ